MKIEQAYSNWSSSYDTDHNLTRDLDRSVTRETLANRRCSTVVELGCGTGKNTAWLAEIAERVCAIDFSAGMLEQARRKNRSARVAFLAADLTRSWPCRSESAQLVVGNLVLEHIQHLPFIFSEAARLLQRGGRLFICELHPFRQYQGSQANFQRGSETIAIPVFLHHLSDFTDAAAQSGLALLRLREWWHETDAGKVPRLVSFEFEK